MVKDKHGYLPLQHFVRACDDSIEIIKYLVQRYPEAINELDKHGKTPLEWAREHRLASVSSWLESVTIRWVRVGGFILLRALVDQGRANNEPNDSVHEIQHRFDLMEFVFVASPVGVFASIMAYL